MSATSDTVVEVRSLTKDFGPKRALDCLNLNVSAGEIHGFLGPYGAGKSTTLRVLLGLIRPTSGSTRVFGLDPWHEPVTTHRDIAYVPGDVSLWPNLSGGEVIDLLTSLRGGADRALLRQLVEDFEFDPRRKARTYSKGNRQKASLIAALACPARLYLLDEPSAGLDPLMDSVFRRHIRRVASEGATILLSSHILSEVEQLCNRVTIIRSGRAVETGTLDDLRHLKLTHFRIEGADDAVRLAELPGVLNIHQQGDVLEFDIDAADLGSVLPLVAASNPRGLAVSPPSLESLFLRHYGDRTGKAR